MGGILNEGWNRCDGNIKASKPHENRPCSPDFESGEQVDPHAQVNHNEVRISGQIDDAPIDARWHGRTPLVWNGGCRIEAILSADSRRVN